MKQPGRTRKLIVSSTATAVALGAGGLVIASTADASTAMAATTWVNMRSGPATSYGVVQVLAPQQDVLATGTVTDGWYQVTVDDVTGWVYRSYLAATGSGSTTQDDEDDSDAPTATGTAKTTTELNVRTGPGTSYAIIVEVPGGTVLQTTGTKSGGWTQVIYNGVARWVSTAYLTSAGSTSGSTTGSTGGSTSGSSTGSTTGSSTEDNSTKVTGQVRTSANLYLRTGGSIDDPSTGVLPANSVVDTTGKTTDAYTQIVYNGELRWIATRYTTSATASAPAAPTQPSATGTVYVNVGILNVRSTSDPSSAVVGTVTRGTALATTGVTSGDRTQIVYNGAARWVYTAYTSTTKPSTTSSSTGTSLSSSVTTSGISQLTPSAKAVYQAVLDNFTQIRTIYGWRASSDYSSDHPNGRAVDIMLSNWSSTSGANYGWEVAHYFQQNAAKYNVSYIIYRQSLWNAAYPARGWRAMEDRGSNTANHYDHVHVSVKS